LLVVLGYTRSNSNNGWQGAIADFPICWAVECYPGVLFETTEALERLFFYGIMTMTSTHMTVTAI
jgi:hypothetical protein